MTEKQMTDEELWEKYATDDEGNLIGTPSFSGRDVAVGKESFVKALTESRKGMFTEADMKEAYIGGWGDSNTDTCFKEWFDKHFTERKGQ
jgi:hypothetical protein